VLVLKAKNVNHAHSKFFKILVVGPLGLIQQYELQQDNSQRLRMFTEAGWAYFTSRGQLPARVP